jgi:hypothetical protein
MRVEAKIAGQSVEDIVPLDDEARELLADEALRKLAIQEANEALTARTVSRSALAKKSEDSALVAIVLEAARKMHT